MNEPGVSWRAGVSRYQWLVLVIASAGWVFDAFEGQIFNINRDQMLGEILGVPSGDPGIRYWGDQHPGRADRRVGRTGRRR